MIELFYQKRDGFTFIEVITAIAILGIFIVAFSNIVTVSIQANEKADKLFKATLISNNLMEEITSHPKKPLLDYHTAPERKNIDGLYCEISIEKKGEQDDKDVYHIDIKIFEDYHTRKPISQKNKILVF
ncbi:MAG: prepilin-type N-terminal cleavage/methylation domain-containing protein [Clostridia bacterium]|nr:prepilin-type N-terminal cleavage/methylation domain-containing protein [Clostridia bacterium]